MRSGFTPARAGVLIVLLSACSSDSRGPFIACQQDSDCPPQMPMCHPQAKVCVTSIAGQQTCPPMQMCDEAQNRCVPYDPSLPCVRNSDCPRLGVDPPNRILCWLERGICVNCITDQDCLAPKLCIQNLCQLVIDGGADGETGDGGVDDGPSGADGSTP